MTVSQPITASRMAKLLDEWATGAGLLIGEPNADFGLSEKQLEDAVAQAAVAITRFCFSVGLGSRGNAGPIVAVVGDAWQQLQFLRDERTEVLGAWHDIALHTEHHLVTAMLNDILWMLRYEERHKPHIYARVAISNYLEYFDDLPDLNIEHRPVHQHDLLFRALELATAINAQTEVAAIAERCQGWLSDVSDEEAYWAISTAARLPVDHRPSHLSERMHSLHAIHAASSDSDTWIKRENLYRVELKMAEADGDKRLVRQVRTGASRLFIAEAKDTDSALKAGRFLQEAEEWAKGAEAESALIGEIRALRSELSYDNEFSEIATETTVPSDEVQRIVQPVRSANSLSDAVLLTTRLGLELLGGIDAIEASALKAYGDSVMIHLVSRVHLVHGNIECCRPHSEEAKRRRAIAEHYRLHALTAAHLVITPCLATIGDRPRSERVDLHQLMADSVVIDDLEAEKFARAFELYWDDDYDTAVHVAIPRIESSVRNLARRAGIDVSFPPQGDECGGLKGLRPILHELRGVIGESNSRMLEYLLVDNHAMNLRDSYLHGVPSADPASDAALVLWIVLWLASLRAENAAPTQTPERAPSPLETRTSAEEQR